jgi:hypothetical protein
MRWPAWSSTTLNPAAVSFTRRLLYQPAVSCWFTFTARFCLRASASCSPTLARAGKVKTTLGTPR